MEFFVWCWIWDRRLLCGLNHGKALFIYLWIIPMIISISVLPYAFLRQTREDKSKLDSNCNLIDEVNERGDRLRNLIYIEEAIILLSILTSLGMVLRTRFVYKQLITRKNGAFDAVSSHFDYCWEVRERSLKSCIGYLTLIIGMGNYVFSMVFIN